jgi:hypothetical protein
MVYEVGILRIPLRFWDPISALVSNSKTSLLLTVKQQPVAHVNT